MGKIGDKLKAYKKELGVSPEKVFTTMDARYGELGEIPNPLGGTSTEYSITEYVPELGGWVNIPTLVDGQKDVNSLLSGKPITREQRITAIRRALQRKSQGAKLPSYGEGDVGSQAFNMAIYEAGNRKPSDKYAPYSVGDVDRTLKQEQMKREGY